MASAKTAKRKRAKQRQRERDKAGIPRGPTPQSVDLSEPDSMGEVTESCMVCGAGPVLDETGMCGPCTFGEADTIGGNW